MKFGIRIPPPQMGPIGDPDFVIRYAKLVESLGFESIWVIDHALMCIAYDSTYPYKTTGRTPIPAEANMPDPLVLMTWIAAATERLRLGTSMLILPQRHPILLAKEIATLDRYSKGRVTLGVGVGWVKEEVEILKQDFGDRGPPHERVDRGAPGPLVGGPLGVRGRLLPVQGHRELSQARAGRRHPDHDRGPQRRRRGPRRPLRRRVLSPLVDARAERRVARRS